MLPQILCIESNLYANHVLAYALEQTGEGVRSDKGDYWLGCAEHSMSLLSK